MLLNAEVTWTWQAQMAVGRLYKLNLVTTGFVLLSDKAKLSLISVYSVSLFLQHVSLSVLLLLSHTKVMLFWIKQSLRYAWWYYSRK